MRITVLGAGLVGRAIVCDLARDPDLRVTAVDRDGAALASVSSDRDVEWLQSDLALPGAVEHAIESADLVVSAVPGFMGFETLRRVVDSGKDVVDIAFFPEDPFELDELARDRGVTAVVDCGVAPGLSNIIAGRLADRLDRVDSFLCYVGGLPAERRWPFEYKAGFSPADVLEEYTRPARFVAGGEAVVRPALSDVELLDFPGVGTLEAFNTDGLRTLQHTLGAPFMKEKTLRYPGHAELMKIFRETGLLSTEPLTVKGVNVRPLDVTSELLFARWRYDEGEEDLTVLQVIVEGQLRGESLRITYDLLDRYDASTATSSMARTTGYTCAIVARQVLTGRFKREGISPPEFVGRRLDCYDDLLAGYEERGIDITERIESNSDRDLD